MSQFYRSKAAGETAVREAFPAATIVRPGPMFGHEDKFLTNMPCMSFLPFSLLPDPSFYNQCGLSGGSSTTVRPRLALYMCALIISVSSASVYLTPDPPRYSILPRLSRTSLECPPSAARSRFQAHQHSHTSISSNSSRRSPATPLRAHR